MSAKETVRAWQEASPREDQTLQQGSPEWHRFRAGKFGASEAAAMMGVSPYGTRGELLREKFTGATNDVDASLQKVFDKGHATEAAARPIAEKLIGQELYPVVVSRALLSASCDGLTMDDAIALEHKQFEKDLFAAVSAGILPDHHVPQCQQVLLITDAERLLFVCSDGTEANFASVWVEPDYEYMAKLIAGWKQFEADLAAFKPVESAPAVVGATVESFPVLTVQLSGAIIASNLIEYEAEIIARIKAIKDDLQTDADFADAEKMVKALKEAKEAMGLSIKQARASVEDIDKLFNTAERIAAELDAKRLWLDKLVKTRKESRRMEIVKYGKDAFDAHLSTLNTRLGRTYLIPSKPPTPMPDFAGAISGKRNFQAMQDAVDSALANAKLQANAIADALQINLRHFANIAEQYAPLFRDLDALLFKPADDFALIVKARIADHKAEQDRKLEADRERIRKEEEAKATAKAEAEARAKIAAEQAAQPTPAPVAQKQVATATAARPANDGLRAINAPSPKPARPTDTQIIDAIASTFNVSRNVAIDWICEMDLGHQAAE